MRYKYMKCIMCLQPQGDILPGLKYPILRQTACASLLVQSESVIVPHVPEK